MNMGADKYIKKPAPIAAITGALDEIIRRGPRQKREPIVPQQELNLAKLYNETLVNKLKQKNDELSEQTEALQASEEKFRQLAENISEVLWITSADLSSVLYISPSYEKVWGCTCQSLRERPISFAEAIHEADRPGMMAALEELRRGHAFDLEFRVVRPDGQIRWVHSRGSAIRDDAGIIYRLGGIAEDITRRKETERQLRQAQKMESIGKLAGGVAHDFNNLLMIIGANLELLLTTDKDLKPQSKEHLAHIAHAADRATTLNRQLLSFSRSEAAQTQVLNLNDLIANFTKLLRRILGEDIRVLNEFAPALPPIKADPGMMEQILMNLAVNARDAMPAGGQLIIGTQLQDLDAARAELDSRMRPGRFACLSVRDTGTGIAPENLSRIFEPFFTTKAAGHGTGLGLATVFGIAEQHKGWVDVSSQVGVGTTFTVFLPVTQEEFAAPDAAARKKVLGGGEKILVVEDDKSVRKVVSEILRRQGYVVMEADSGLSARQIWANEAQNLDLLLTDVVMPGGLTGLELVEELRQQKPELKVVLTSGYSSQLVSSEVALSKNLSFLTKPYSSQTLAETVRKSLDGQGAPAAEMVLHHEGSHSR
jgi:PAS domain S-box-containing protein